MIYLDYNTLKAKIINIHGWCSIYNDITNSGIYENQIIKIERIMEADDENIEDLTKNENL